LYYLIWIKYEVIGPPFVVGSVQDTVMVSSASDQVVAGASGLEGFEAIKTDKTPEYSEIP
jgi:hypothetical protein